MAQSDDVLRIVCGFPADGTDDSTARRVGDLRRRQRRAAGGDDRQPRRRGRARGHRSAAPCRHAQQQLGDVRTQGIVEGPLGTPPGACHESSPIDSAGEQCDDDQRSTR